MNEIIRGIIIYLIVPLLGLTGYLLLCRRMQQRNIPQPPYISWFIILIAYGLLFIVLMDFWIVPSRVSTGAANRSEMEADIHAIMPDIEAVAMVGVWFVAPFFQGLIAVRSWRRYKISGYHAAAVWAATIWMILWVSIVVYVGPIRVL